MKKVIFIITLLCVCCVMTSSSTEAKAQNEKITICHIPPGNPENSHEITVSINALNAHLAHGDTIGKCNGGGEEK
ncbi:hypothetical protein ACFS5M_08455 [Lacinutrix iliipiscaria]|uniref:Secreted protein n=1 Tax=Lacinutrix iliipiscaria TaxID=1230532 RepID=A0ABW5WLX0_9FLAO